MSGKSAKVAGAPKMLEASVPQKTAAKKAKPLKAKPAARSSSPEPSERPESFSTPTRPRTSTTPQAATPKTKTVATPRAAINENDQQAANVIVSPSQLIKKGEFGKKGSKPLVPLDAKVQRIYKLINKSTGALGGNGYDGAIYGELTMHSMQKVTDVLTGICGMTAQSRFIDVGSGLGKPNFHVSQSPGVRISVGIELERIRWQLAMYNLGQILPHTQGHAAVARSREEDKLKSGVHFLCGDIFDAVTMDPFTHVYMYDLGFPPPLQQKIAQNFNSSVHCEYLISYRPPHRIMNEYGYLVTPVAQIPTSMHGSGEIHTAYFYKRANDPSPLREKAGVSIITINGRDHVKEDARTERIACDNLFKDSVLLAAGSAQDAVENVQAAVETLTASGRPVRERRVRVL